ncbi:tRNA modification GTPase gtpbp3, mitochondrial [Pseudocyphellaria aurata]|nr:tRNA modification GTPase gtpbp3, mitochondrial [Pseudocyphellaria aurata]
MRQWRNKPHCWKVGYSCHHPINQKLAIPPIRSKSLSQAVGLTHQDYSRKTCPTRDSRLVGYGKRRLGSLQRQHDSTIYALSTPPGRSAIAIIRISGPACLHVRSLGSLFANGVKATGRYAALRTLYEPGSLLFADPQVLDPNALVLFFPAPKTVTGEDVLELHLHGGAAVVKAVLNAIPKTLLPSSQADLHSLCYAEPGEFTRRAFYNNRLDLTQIEALGDTLSAETEQQRRLAVRGATNALAREYEDWRQKLLYARGELEAFIDFSEDQHFDESSGRFLNSVATQVGQLRRQMQTNIQNSFRGELLRNGISVALVGAPNAGKSSLLNKIVQREASIVSKQAGTTRDVVEVGIDIGGFYCRFGDLAGLRGNPPGREDIGEIEMEGMRRAKTHARNADVIILVLSSEDLRADAEIPLINSEVKDTLRSCDAETQRIVCVINKSDLVQTCIPTSEIYTKLNQHSVLQEHSVRGTLPVFVVSCKEAEALAGTDNSDPGAFQTFLQGLTSVFESMTTAHQPHEQFGGQVDSSRCELSLGASERQRRLLQQCAKFLDAFLDDVRLADSHDHTDDEDTAAAETDVVLAAENLRSAADCLAKITGRGEAGDVEEVLGVVFQK